MLFEHASYAFPSEWIILLDVLLTVLAAALILSCPRLLARPACTVWRQIRRLARKRRTVLIALFLLGGVGTALLLVAYGPPLARIPDEKSYLLAADTFAHGRLSNPSHPGRAHFVTAHVLHEPVYASKYPPAQGLLLALGQRLTGHAAGGLVLSSALLCLAVGWALAGALSPPWQLLGGLLALMRFGVGSYWNQSYWGGSVAATGGALVLGALLRLRDSSRPRDGIWLMLGLALLAHSRPVEGICFALGAGGVLLWLGLRAPGSRAEAATAGRLRPIWLPLIVGSSLIVATIIGYNLRVSGAALTFPHQLHASQFPEYVHFVWQLGPGWMAEAARLWGRKLAFTLYFFLGTAPIVALLLTSRSLLARTPARMAIILGATTVVALMPIRPYHAHYPAPLAAATILLATVALRILACSRWREHRIGRPAVLAIMAIQLVSLAHQVPAHRPDATDWARQRADIHARLLVEPGLDLILVEYPNGRPDSWVWNDADIDASEVVWAESLGNARDRALIARFPARRIWRIAAEFSPVPPRLREVTPPDNKSG